MKKIHQNGIEENSLDDPSESVDQSELTFRMDYKNSQTMEEALAHRKTNKYISTEVQGSRTDAANRYRDRHQNIETNYKKNKLREK